MNEAVYLSDMATAMFPHVSKDRAVRNLKRLMRQNPDLQRRLAQTYYDPHSRVLTPRQAALVREYLM